MTEPLRLERSPKRVRVYLAGHLVADSLSPWLVWELPYFPTYYFPRQDVLAELVANGNSEHSARRGKATMYDVAVEGERASGAASVYADSPLEQLRSLVRIRWDAMDEWLEEDEPVYTHPRDPYTRVDILASSRRVQVRIDGVELADSDQPRIVFETGLPPRFYLPLSQVRTELLRPSATVTHCPYKGEAHYWSVEVNGTLHQDAVWTYRTPLPEAAKIAGLAAFYNERVDLMVDGTLQERPRTRFS